MPERLLAPLAGLVLLAALAAAVPSGAQTSQDLDDVQGQQEELEGELDVLRADYRQLEAAVEASRVAVRRTEAAKREAEQRLEVARAEVRAAQAAVADMREQIGALQERVQEDAVVAYIHPDPLLSLMESDDLTLTARREALLSSVAGSRSDVLDLLNGLEIDLVAAEARARQAREQVEAEQAEVQRRLRAHRDQLAEQRRLQEALDQRIADVQAEVEALAAEEDRIQAALARAASRAPVSPSGSVERPPSASGLIWPVNGVITSPFGQRWGRLHAGIDIGAPSGTPIYASNSGTVLTGCGGGYGNCVMIDHGGGFVTLYAHMTSVFVGGGQRVSRGQNIGTVGCTGSCTGPHLHFETRINGTPHDPMQYLP